MDYLGIAMTELGNIAERRLARLTDEASNAHALPAFLTEQGGLHSGFMITQYTAAALATENKVLAHPASVDTIPTSANVEDHVSMGVTAGLKLRQIHANVERILAIELLAAAQGVDFRRKRLGPAAQLGQGTRHAYALIRQHVPFVEQDTCSIPTSRRCGSWWLAGGWSRWSTSMWLIIGNRESRGDPTRLPRAQARKVCYDEGVGLSCHTAQPYGRFQ